ncbi:MarR family transcriptional regulator [Flammeovirgaceae bacterium SG7u.111]|nr:MarR family transcriptional regulator [Flammeovirgaceae bacterium SG7u.132]WPO34496.1 MarR family transcriptional regulator [Flammeovirgaceae bacterium SG7u.111]
METEKVLFEIIDFIAKATKENKEGVLSEDEFSRLTINQFYYLDLIGRLEKPTLSKLAEELQITRPSVSAIVNKLIEKGYVYKTQSEDDQRIFYLFVSDRGRELIDAEHKIYRAFALHVKTTLNQEELTQFTNILSKILKNLPDVNQ